MSRPPRQPASVAQDRLPPHSPEAERGVLGCLLVDAENGAGGQAWEECVRRRLQPEHFYDLRHQKIFGVMQALVGEGQPVDMLLLIQALTQAGELHAVGGYEALTALAALVPSAANLPYYLDEVLDRHTLRRTIRLCTETIAAAFEHPPSASEFVGHFEARALALAEAHVPTEFVPLPECVPAYIDAIESRHRGKQEITGLATPFWYLNNITCGLQPREFVVLGARPSTGKTALALEIMRHALKSGEGVLFFSIEMARQEIMGRIVAAEAKVDGIKLRNGFWSEAKAPDIIAATKRVGSWDRFLIDDRSVITGQDVYVAARRAQRLHQIGLVVVDYLQLMKGSRSYPSRMEEVAEASAWLKRTAKELNLPVVACAQLSRDSEKSGAGRVPLMSDLRECGNIEQDADVVALLWEPKLDDDEFDDMKWIAHHVPDDPKEDSEWNTAESKALMGGGRRLEVNRAWREEFRRINLTIAKNRNGQTGPCELVYQRRSTRFVDAHSPKRVKEEKGQLL